MWKVIHKKIAVKEYLMAKGIVIENGGLCSACGLAVETSKHLKLLSVQVSKISYMIFCGKDDVAQNFEGFVI